MSPSSPWYTSGGGKASSGPTTRSSRWRGGYNTTSPPTPSRPRRSSHKASAAFVTRGATVLFALGVATLLASFSDNASLGQQQGLVVGPGRSSPVSRFLRAVSASEDQPLLKYYHTPGTSMGDQMFAWSSTAACAARNDMFPCTFYSDMDDSNAMLFRTYFRGPFHQCADAAVGYGWDAGDNSTIDYGAFRRDPADRQDVALYGQLRSYRNFDFMADDVRATFDLKARYLTPTEAAVEPFETEGFLTVGLHVRWDGMAGAEYLSRAEAGEFDPALHQPDIAYYDNAMNLMRRTYGADKIRFLLASDDMAYVRAQSVFVDAPDVVFIDDISQDSMWQLQKEEEEEDDGAEGEEEKRGKLGGEDPRAAFIRDFAILRRCQHMITSVGSYSWWAAYLGPYQTGGRVLYYDEWKRAHSEDAAYFPPEWVRVPEIPSEAETIVFPLDPTEVGDGKLPYGSAGELPEGVIPPQEQGTVAGAAVVVGDAPDTVTSTESAAPPEDAPQDSSAEAQFATEDFSQGEDVVNLSTPDPEGEVLSAEEEVVPSEGEVPSAPFDGVAVAYPSDGEPVDEPSAAAAATPGDEIPQDQPIAEGEDAVDIGDATSNGLKGFVKGLLGGGSSNEQDQESAEDSSNTIEEDYIQDDEAAEATTEEFVDIAEERRDAEVPLEETAFSEADGPAKPSDKSRRLNTDDMLRQVVQQEQEAEIAARKAAENEEPYKATMTDADEMRRKAVRKMAMEQAAELARNMGIPTTPKAPDVLELEMPE